MPKPSVPNPSLRGSSASRSRADRLTAVQRRAVRELLGVSTIMGELGRRFHEAGEEIALVGGSVRDALLGRLGTDLDFATSAHPSRTEKLVRGWADAVWDLGRAYGTIGCRKGNRTLEITTYRAESYDPDSRHPDVEFGRSLEDDLRRRDFTVNAMAVALPGREQQSADWVPRFIDPFGGLEDLAAKVLRTPAAPEESFGDDPLRMMRAARFAAQLGFEVAEPVRTAMRDMADRIDIISAERIRDELVKLICGDYPRAGLSLLVESGLANRVLPELPRLRLESDEHHRHKDVYEHTLTVLEQTIDLEHRIDAETPDFVVRFAALMHDVGKPATRRFEADGRVTFYHHDVVGAKLTRKRMRALRFPNDVIDDVSRLVELHLRFHGYGTGEWTDSAVRRYVRDAGHLLDRLHVLTRADCTTRNKRKAAALWRAYDNLEARITKLSEEEELAKIRPDLDGNQIMEILGISPGPLVGRAYRHMLNLRLDKGPLSREEAEAELRRWWAEQPEAKSE